MGAFFPFTQPQRMEQKKKVEMDLRLWSVYSILSIQKNRMEDNKRILAKDKNLEKFLIMVFLQSLWKFLPLIMENVYHPSEKCQALSLHLVPPPAPLLPWLDNIQQIFHLILRTMDTLPQTTQSLFKGVEAKGILK